MRGRVPHGLGNAPRRREEPRREATPRMPQQASRMRRACGPAPAAAG